MVGLLIAGVGVSAAFAHPNNGNGGKPPSTVPGSPGDVCSHGDNGRECRADPNVHGKDCYDHGSARGNEDHCDQATTTTTTTTTTPGLPVDWTLCASEGSRCQFSGTAAVRYGADTTFTSPGLFTDGVDCSNAIFGDPIFGVVKHCEYRAP
jgi:hypothetical protein